MPQLSGAHEPVRGCRLCAATRRGAINSRQELVRFVPEGCSSLDMKLSHYAQRAGVTDKTVWRWVKMGQLDA